MSLHPSYPSKSWSKAVAAAGGRWVQGGAALQVTLKQQVSCSKELDLRGTCRPHRHIALHSSHTLSRYILQYSRHFTMALGLRVGMQINDMLPHWYLSVMSVKKNIYIYIGKEKTSKKQTDMVQESIFHWLWGRIWLSYRHKYPSYQNRSHLLNAG